MNSYGGRTLTYDANGNRLTDSGPAGTTTYVWDGRNRLQSITQPNGAVTRFTYDFHRNVTEQAATASGATATTGFLMDDITNVVAIYGGAGGTLSLLTGQGIDDHLATINSAGQAEFALTDALGSVAAVSGASKGLDGNNEYEPYGETTSTGAGFPFAFTGRDPVTGNIYYYRNRFYDSSVGRFLSEDPTTMFTGDSSLYTYAFDAPLTFTDPRGTDGSMHTAMLPAPDAPVSMWNDFLLWEILTGPGDALQQLIQSLQDLFKKKQCETNAEEQKKLADQIAAQQQQLQALQAQLAALKAQAAASSNPGSSAGQ